ncbi:hypothetical protein BpHYR1_037690 [Brachionus plicatilis]|uniref:Uncharacterized protein n=1 Tax=Brachionus plicatilis TaxID=10195 RepID=A0A3M7PHP0_BRAPC|nr:hypothetical protein BpHYR1_037690 [Brachionus plicatilis]
MVNRHLFSTSSILLKRKQMLCRYTVLIRHVEFTVCIAFFDKKKIYKAKPIWIKLRFKISKLADPKGQQIQLIEMDKHLCMRQIEVHDQIHNLDT